MKTYSRHILFCDGKNCDGKRLQKAADKLLGDDSERIITSKVGCVGSCKAGPIVMVYPDGVWYRCPNKKSLRKIIREHVQSGRPVEKYVLQTMKPD